MTLIASNLLAGIESEISGLKTSILEGDPRKINQSLVTLQLAINQLEPIDSSVDAPSAARIKARQSIQQAIEPIKGELILLTNNSDSTVAQTATMVLGSAKPSIEVYNALKGNLEQTKSPGVAASSLLALSKAGVLDDEAGTIAADRISEYQTRVNPDLGLNLVRTAAFVPVPQATDQLIEILKSDDRIGARMTAANAIMKLGPAGAEALPELKKLKQELEQNGGDFRDINTINRAIMLASGRSNTPQAVMPSTTAAQTTPVPPLPVQQPKSEAAPSIKIEVETPSSSSFPILPVAILAAVIVGIVLYILRRKSK